MNDPAQATTTRQQMMQRMRSNFSQSTASPVTVPAQPVHPVAPTPPPAPDDLSDAQKLDLFEQVLDQVEEQPLQLAPTAPVAQASTPPAPAQPSVQPPVGTVIDQALPYALQATDPLNPPQAGHSTAKERVESTAAPDTSTIDAGTGVQYVEQEKSPEIPVEVESYLKKVESHADSQPHEVVIADGSIEQAGTAYPSRPVIVLPITEEIEEEGQKKSPKFSVRWLVEWSHKIIKMFAGKVIYRET